MSSAEVDTIPVKLVFKDEIRRSNCRLVFKNLVQSARQLFSCDTLKFAFVDEEGDTCTITNDSELLEAAAISKAMGKVLRITCTSTRTAIRSGDSSTSEEVPSTPAGCPPLDDFSGRGHPEMFGPPLGCPFGMMPPPGMAPPVEGFEGAYPPFMFGPPFGAGSGGPFQMPPMFPPPQEMQEVIKEIIASDEALSALAATEPLKEKLDMLFRDPRCLPLLLRNDEFAKFHEKVTSALMRQHGDVPHPRST